MCAVIVAAGVTAAAVVGAAVVAKSSADKAAAAQKKALQRQGTLLQRELNPDKVNALAQRIDEERAKNRIEFQKQIDPELARLRSLSKEQLLQEAQTPVESRQSTQVANQLFKENVTADPRMEALKGALIDRATSELAAGATLPPEFQAELVRSGLNTGSQAGFKADQRTVGGTIARALGAGGLAIQQQRQNSAIQLTQEAQDIATTRTNILASIFPKIRDLEAANRNVAVQNFGLADTSLPEVGLSGTDAANLQLASVKANATLAAKRGDIASQQALAQGAFTSQLIGAAASGVSGALGAYKTPTTNSAPLVTPIM